MDTSLLGLVSGFYDASMDGRLWPPVLRRIGDALGARGCALAVHDYETDAGRFDQAVDVDADYVASYRSRYGERDVWLKREEHFRTPGQVWTSQQILSDDDVLQTDFYRNWLAPQNLLHHLFGVLDRRGGTLTCLVLARPERDGPFGDKEAGLLRLLLPRFQRGLRSGEAFRRAQDVERAALAALDAMPFGVVLLSGAGGVLGANAAARSVIDAGDVLTVGEGGLWVDWGWRKARFRDLISPAAADKTRERRNRAQDVPAFSVPRAPGQKPLSLLVVPAGEGNGRELADRPAALLFLGDPDRPVEIDPQRLTQLYGLSRAEARVVALLAAGQRLDQVAESLGVAYETVRKHLKQVFAKTGVDRQAELVRMVATGPAGLRS